MPESIIKADNISSLNGGGIGFPDGSVSDPSLKFTNDGDTGLYRPNNNELGFVTNGSEKFRIESTGQIKAVYESQVGTDYNTQLDNGYLCRAWVNFDGTLAAASMIRASGNVSSILDNGTGDYTINFTTAMPDANYCVTHGTRPDGAAFNGTQVRMFGFYSGAPQKEAPTTTSFRLLTFTQGSNNGLDSDYVMLGVFR